MIINNQILKVLILEDNLYDAELNIKNLQKEWNIESRIATDEKSFYLGLEKFDPDIIISDYNLPVFNGLDALNVAKKNKPLTPFIIVTGSLDEETAVDCIKKGAWDYVLKEHLIRLNPAVKYALQYKEEIQQRKLAEEKILQTGEHYKVLTENSPDVIMRFDRDLKHLYVNQAVTKIVPLKPEAFLNRTHREMGIFPELLCQFWENNIEKVFLTQAPNEVNFEVEGKQGTIYLEWRLFPEFNKEKRVETVLAIARNITQQKTAKEALIKSEERLQMALDATSDGIWDLSIDSEEIYFSSKYFTMLGYNYMDINHDIPGTYRLLHPADRLPIRKQLTEFLNGTSESIEYEMRMKKKDGSYAWISSRGKVFKKDKLGKPLRVVGTHVDITQRKKQENIQNTLFVIANAINTTRNLDELFISIQEALGKVIDTKNCYVALYDKATDTITLPFHKDEKDTFTSFPAGKSLTGYTIKTGKALLVDKVKAEELEKTGEVERIGTPSESWLGVPLKHGKKIIGVFVVQSYNKNTVFTTDDVQILEFVSDQIALAIERKKDHDDILENQIRQSRIIESSPDGLIVIDEPGTISEYNTSVLEILNIRAINLKGKNFLDFIIPEEKNKVIKILSQTKKSGYRKNIEFSMIRNDGEQFYAEASFGLIPEQEELSLSYVVIIKNIDDRKSYETNLRLAKEKAEESDRLKTAFLSNMSHEIRTPMNAIVGFAGLLSSKEISDMEKKEFIMQINHSADSLMHLIDDIIDIAKIEAGQVIMQPAEFKFPVLINELKFMFKKILEKFNKQHIKLIEYHNDFQSDIPIFADQFRLKQIFSNLINNAIKFTEFGEIRFGIKDVNNKTISFYVSDTGIGIEPDKVELIFDRFRQGHETNAKFFGGTGLGLAISKHLAEMMGGNISVESELNKGSEFCFSIPFISPNKKEEFPDEAEADIDLDLSDKIILIAEDEDSSFTFLEEALKKKGAKLIRAKDGLEVVSLFRQIPGVSMVLMDIRLPLQDGYKAARLIKEIKPEIPVIAQTAYAMVGEKKQSLLSGCDDYLAKPVMLNELYTIVKKYV